MGAFARIKNIFGMGEGSSRSVFGEGELGGWYQINNLEADGFQRNLSITGRDARHIPAAYASVMANARAVSQCRPTHRRKDSTGKHTVIENSAAFRIFRKPNNYETWSQFILNSVAQMQFDGECFVLVGRNDRQEVVALNRMDSKTCQPYITDGELFYSVGSNPMLIETADYLVPARDCLHLRSHCPRHPLMGESPIKAAAMAAGISVSLSQHQLAFFANMSRPSGILSTSEDLTREQLESLRAAWKAKSQGVNSGEIPVLGGGLKFQALGITSQDAQLIQAQRMAVEDIARVYGTPLPVIGDMSNSTMNNVEQLVSLWLSISLGATLENIERSLERLFQMPPSDSIELDATALLRTDFQTRIDGLTKAVQGGVYTPNEAREREGLHPVKKGDTPYLQSQMVELGYKPEPVAPPVAPEAAPVEESTSDPDPEATKGALIYSIKRAMQA